MGLFDSLADLAGDVVSIATAPVKVAVDATRVVVKPIATVAKEVTETIHQEVNEVTKDIENL